MGATMETGQETGLMTRAEIGLRAFDEAFESILEAIEQARAGDGLVQLNEQAIRKCDGLAKVLFTMQAQMDELKAEEQRLQKKRTRIESLRGLLLEGVKVQMEAWGTPKIHGGRYSFVVKTNPPSVVIDDEAAIPAEFKTTPEPVVSKQAVKDALQAGREVPGAHLETERTRLEVK